MTDFTPIDEEPRPEYDWSKPSLAVVACDGNGHGCVLWTAGPHVESLVHEAGVTNLSDLGLDDAPEGISIWEGTIKTVHHNTPDANEYDSWLEGSFREPTSKEWESIRKNECPWNDDEWHK
jgi:hypothetical protein